MWQHRTGLVACPEASKITLEQKLSIPTLYGPICGYQDSRMENPDVVLQSCIALNLATLLLASKQKEYEYKHR